jgi:ribosomal protein S18 acetylase RimI-like enzyme
VTPAIQEVGASELRTRVEDPFLRHRVSPARIERAWINGRAFAVCDRRPRFGVTLTVLGDAGDGGDLLEALAGDARYDRVRLDAEIPMPARYRMVSGALWDWMLTDAPVEEPDAVDVLDPVADAPAINALLDAANADAHGRPDDDDVPTWVGVHDGDDLVAVGALELTEDGSGHLRSVTTREDTRGRGLGHAVSARLTNLAIGGASGVATLGVYCDNHVARRIYERLGYRLDRTFRAGTLTQR